ncbi:MAG: hypothetical protein V4687_17820 [Bacteroidota bacterium]
MTVVSKQTVFTAAMKNALEVIPQEGPGQLEAAILNSGILYSIILEYEYGKGNLQDVRQVTNSLTFNGTHTGMLMVSYAINEFSMCAAIDYTERFVMKIEFKINLFQTEITFSGEQRYERNDEF